MNTSETNVLTETVFEIAKEKLKTVSVGIDKCKCECIYNKKGTLRPDDYGCTCYIATFLAKKEEDIPLHILKRSVKWILKYSAKLKDTTLCSLNEAANVAVLEAYKRTYQRICHLHKCVACNDLTFRIE